MLPAGLYPRSCRCSQQRLRIDQRSENETRRILNLNFDFPLFLTRAFLPQLRKGSLSTGWVGIVFVGSLAGESNLPFLCAYSSSKSFLKRAACILHAEEGVLQNSNVLFTYLNVGEVRSSGLGGKPSFLRPSADDFAKAVVRSLGCGRRVVVPWYPHDVLVGILSLMPETLFEWFARSKLAVLAKDIVLEKDR